MAGLCGFGVCGFVVCVLGGWGWRQEIKKQITDCFEVR